MATIRAADGGYLLNSEQFNYTKDAYGRPVLNVNAEGGSTDGMMKADGTVAMTGNLQMDNHAILGVTSISNPDGEVAIESETSMNNHKITDLATPTANNDAATKAYVDGNAGLKIETVYNHASNTNLTSGVYEFDTAPSKAPAYYIVTCKFNGATADYKVTSVVTAEAEHTMWSFMPSSTQSVAREIKIVGNGFTLYDGMTVSLGESGWTTAIANALMVPIKIDAVIM